MTTVRDFSPLLLARALARSLGQLTRPAHSASSLGQLTRLPCYRLTTVNHQDLRDSDRITEGDIAAWSWRTHFPLVPLQCPRQGLGAPTRILRSLEMNHFQYIVYHQIESFPHRPCVGLPTGLPVGRGYDGQFHRVPALHVLVVCHVEHAVFPSRALILLPGGRGRRGLELTTRIWRRGTVWEGHCPMLSRGAERARCMRVSPARSRDYMSTRTACTLRNESGRCRADDMFSPLDADLRLRRSG